MGRPQRIAATLATLAAILTFWSPTAHGWSNDPLAFVLDERQIHQPVGYLTWCLDCVGVDYTTQEPWVVNPTQCMWDVDDEFRYTNSFTNVLAAGATASITECAYKGSQLFAASTRLSSPSPDLVVTYSFTWDTGSKVYVIPAVLGSDRRWHYNGCIRPEIVGGTAVEVPDSHGGTAVPVTIEVSVTNPTSHRVGKTGGGIHFGWQPYWASGC